MEAMQDFFEKLHLPKGDLYELPTSTMTFPDGANFRIEVPTVNTIEAQRSLLETAKDLGVTVNRIDETYGIMRHTDKELEENDRISERMEIRT